MRDGNSRRTHLGNCVDPCATSSKRTGPTWIDDEVICIETDSPVTEVDDLKMTDSIAGGAGSSSRDGRESARSARRKVQKRDAGDRHLFTGAFGSRADKVLRMRSKANANVATSSKALLSSPDNPVPASGVCQTRNFSLSLPRRSPGCEGVGGLASAEVYCVEVDSLAPSDAKPHRRRSRGAKINLSAPQARKVEEHVVPSGPPRPPSFEDDAGQYHAGASRPVARHIGVGNLRSKWPP